MKIGKITRYDEPRSVHFTFEVPQNNFPVVLIRREVLLEMYNHASKEKHHEVGGYLIGLPVKNTETGTEATCIDKAVRAIYNSTPTHVTMHAESFREVELVRAQSNTILIGYYHSHPGLGIFLSGTDIKNFKDYHSEPYQIAVVVDTTKVINHCLDITTEWIGFFGWDRNSAPIRLPAQNIILVDNRLEGMSTKPVLRLENEITNAIWQANNILRQGLYQFNPKIPIAIIASDVREQLLQRNPNVLNEGLLSGVVVHVGIYDFICVNRTHPLVLDELLEKFINKFKQRYTMPIALTETYINGIDTVGFYSTESKLTKIDIGNRKNWYSMRPTINLRGFSRHCEKYCLVVEQIDKGKPEIGFKVWCEEGKKLIELPKTQIVFK